MTNPKEVIKKLIEISFDDPSYGTVLKLEDIKQFIISSQIATLTSQLEAIPEDEYNPEPYKYYAQPLQAPSHTETARVARNQERQRQRQQLQLAIKEWELLN